MFDVAQLDPRMQALLQRGALDYSMSMGLTAQRNHPQIKKAKRDTIG